MAWGLAAIIMAGWGAATVVIMGAAMGMVETQLSLSGDGSASGSDTNELERLNVADWKLYNVLGKEFDNAMAQHIASLLQQIIRYAREQGKSPEELSSESLKTLRASIMALGSALGTGFDKESTDLTCDHARDLYNRCTEKASDSAEARSAAASAASEVRKGSGCA